MLRTMLEKHGSFNSSSRIFPRDHISTAGDFNRAVDSGIIDGYDPVSPFISLQTPVVTMGSCFAQNVSTHMAAAGYKMFTLPVTDHLFTPHALELFATDLRDKVPAERLMQYWKITQQEADEMRRLITDGAPIIVTFGLSTVWIDKVLGQTVLDPMAKTVTESGKGVRTLPDPARYEMQQMSIEQIRSSIHGLISALRSMGPTNKIILTLSPVSLALSASDQPVIVADCVSKASLRVVLDEIRRENPADIYYFPSFEILKWFGSMISRVFCGDRLLSHIQKGWVSYVVSKFRQYYCLEPHSALPPLPEK